MQLTPLFEPAKEGGYSCFIEEIPAAISQGETLEEAKSNLADALRLVLQYQRELAQQGLSPHAVRESFEIAEASLAYPFGSSVCSDRYRSYPISPIWWSCAPIQSMCCSSSFNRIENNSRDWSSPCSREI